MPSPVQKLDSVWSARVVLHRRDLSVGVADGFLWSRIGTHAAYDRIADQAAGHCRRRNDWSMPAPRKKSADVGIDSAHIARDSQDAGSGHPSPPLTGMPANNPEPHIRDQGVIRQVKLGVTPPRTQILTQDVTYSMLQ